MALETVIALALVELVDELLLALELLQDLSSDLSLGELGRIRDDLLAIVEEDDLELDLGTGLALDLLDGDDVIGGDLYCLPPVETIAYMFLPFMHQLCNSRIWYQDDYGASTDYFNVFPAYSQVRQSVHAHARGKAARGDAELAPQGVRDAVAVACDPLGATFHEIAREHREPLDPRRDDLLANARVETAQGLVEGGDEDLRPQGPVVVAARGELKPDVAVGCDGMTGPLEDMGDVERFALLAATIRYDGTVLEPAGEDLRELSFRDGGAGATISSSR